jgi:UV excision repair protein RAD23
MKLYIRTLKNVEVEVLVDQQDTLLDVKKKVEDALPHMLASEQILIHRGVILEDARTIAYYSNIKDNDKLVAMISKVSFLDIEIVSVNVLFQKKKTISTDLSSTEKCNNVNETSDDLKDKKTSTELQTTDNSVTLSSGPQDDIEKKNLLITSTSQNPGEVSESTKQEDTSLPSNINVNYTLI